MILCTCGIHILLSVRNTNKYLTSPHVLVSPQKHKPFKLYLSGDEHAIGSALIQEFEGKERVIYFISRRLLDAETSKDDVIKYMHRTISRFGTCQGRVLQRRKGSAPNDR